MGLDLQTLGAAKSFVQQSLLGGGAVVGKNVIISSILPIEGGHRIIFSYTLDDGTVEESSLNVMEGRNGIGISSVKKISTVGLVDTYEITFTDNTIYQYNVVNGKKGEKGEQGIQGVQGIQGEKGNDGYPFLIYKEYSDISEFNEEDFPEIGLMFMIRETSTNSFPIYRYTGDKDNPYNHITNLGITESIKGEKGDTGEQGIQGEAGKDGITYTPTIGTVTSGNTPSVSLSVDEENETAIFNFTLVKGEKGLDGNNITKVEKNNTVDNIDTYKIYLSDNTSYDFTVTNGVNGSNGQDGISITNVKLNEENNLTFTLSDGSTISAGTIQTVKGKDGSTPTFSIGEVTTLDSDQNATVNITGTSSNPILNFGIPKGKDANKTDIVITDEKVKLNSSSTAKYLEELIDNSTIVVDTDNGIIKAINLDGLETTIATLNFIKNLDKDIMLYLNSISNPMTFKGVVADDDALTTITDIQSGDTYIVQSSASNSDKTLTFIYNGTEFVPIAETTIEVRDFNINPIDLSKEVTGVLPKEKIDEAIARLADVLTNNTYKGSSDGVVKSADTLQGLIYTIAQLNTAIENSHKHLNKDVLDKIISNGLGNRLLTDNGTYKEFFTISSTAPTDIYTLWIDNTKENKPILKIHDGANWITVSSGEISTETSTTKVTISTEEGNAIIEKEDGLYIEDKSKLIEKLQADVEPIKKYQKYVNTQLDYCYFYCGDNNTVVNNTTNLFSYFTNISNNNMVFDKNGYLKLKKGSRYSIHGSFYKQNTTDSISFSIIDDTSNILYNAGNITTSGHTGMDLVYVTSELQEDLYIGIFANKKSTISFNSSSIIIQEIARSITIDPVEHINTQNGLEDTPVGHIIAHMGTTAPKHYLVCDGSEYNIVDYPYLAEHIKTEFGSYNYFGGDGTTTFEVPNFDKEIQNISPIMTSNTTPNPYVVTTSNNYDDDYAGWKAFTRTLIDTKDSWLTAENVITGWICIDLGSREVIDGFALVSRNSPTNYNKVFPKNFTFEGSNDGINFTVLKTITEEFIETNMERKFYMLDNQVCYRYYKINITKNNGGSYVGIGNIELLKINIIKCIKYEPTYFMNIFGFREETVLFDGVANAIGNYELVDSVKNYDEIYVKFRLFTDTNLHINTMLINTKDINMDDIDNAFLCAEYTGNYRYIGFNFKNGYNKITVNSVSNDSSSSVAITKIIGIHYGTTTEEGTPPSIGSSCSCSTYTDEEISTAISNILNPSEVVE